MKLLVTGAAGQLGWELQRLLSAPELASTCETKCVTRKELDISDSEAVNALFDEFQPDAVINAAAYTAVDKAEEDITQALAVNALGAQNLASACKAHGAYFLHVSTDFVFDGASSVPYTVDAVRQPLGVYGKSKAEGEVGIAATLESQWAIVRTAWVYSSQGNNFVKTMLRLMGEKESLGIVADQVGTPTWAKGLAECCITMVMEKASGVYHWTDAGVASWYDFAVAIQELACEKGLLKKSIPIKPILSSEYPLPAKRPSFSVLDKSATYAVAPALKVIHWRQQLSAMLDEFAAAQSS